METGADRTVEVTTWSLEQHDPGELRRPERSPAVPVEIVRVEEPGPELNRFLYAAVGREWYWVDRLPWPRERWRAWLERPAMETWVAYHRGAPAGYVELDPQPAGAVEIAYFGLLRGFIGKGIGGHLLATGAARAWDLAQRWPRQREPTRRVWVHTCSLDGPAALANYRARGFTIFATTTHTETLPASLPDPPDPPDPPDLPDPPAR